MFVGLGLAAAVSAALLRSRWLHRRSYQPGSGRRDDLPVAPVVYQLRLAHLRASDPDPENADDEADWTQPDDTPAVVIGSATAHSDDRTDSASQPHIGVRHGHTVALDLAAAHGLGLVGPGTAHAARALLLSLLTGEQESTHTTDTQVIVPVADLEALLGEHYSHAEVPSRLHVVDDLNTALAYLETQILHRTRARQADPQATLAPLTLLATAPQTSTPRLQAILDNGADLAITGVLIGKWRAGATAYIHTDGTISATNPGLAAELRDTRMFTLPETDTADLLALLRHAQPEPFPDTTDTARQAHTSITRRARPSQLDATTSTHAQPPQETDPTALEVTAATQGGLEITRPRLHVSPAPARTPRTPKDPGPRSVGRERPDEGPHRSPQPPPAPAPNPAASPQPPHALRQATLSTTPEPPSTVSSTPLWVTMLGAPCLRFTPGSGHPAREITTALRPREREMLLFLALHPQGMQRDSLLSAVWAKHPPQRRTNALNTTRSRLRRALDTATDGALTEVTTSVDSRYQLDHNLVGVDYWHFLDAVAARRAASTDAERVAAYHRIVAAYTGRLADGLDTEWIYAPREATRRDAIDAVAALARTLAPTDPQQTLDLLETARDFDPHNELLYRDIMRLQARLGLLDAIPRTLALLTSRLAEINEHPTPQAITLATQLQQRHDTTLGTHSRGHDHDSAAAS